MNYKNLNYEIENVVVVFNVAYSPTDSMNYKNLNSEIETSTRCPFNRPVVYEL